LGRRILKVFLFALFIFLSVEFTSRTLLSFEPLFDRMKGYDESSHRIDWVKRHHPGEAPNYQFEVYDPVRGWAVKPGVRDATVFGNKVLNTNSRGIRGTTEYAYTRQPRKRRIVVLGDSFTFGYEVSDDETYPSYLGTMLPDTEVLNLGVVGYGLDQILLYLRQEGVKYHPDIVLLGYVWFDARRNLLSFNDFAKPKFEWTDAGLRLTHVPVPTPEEILKAEPYRLKSLDLAVMARERLLWMLGWNDKRAERFAVPVLDALVSTTRDIGATPAFVYLTVWDEMLMKQNGLTHRERFLSQYCAQRGLACLFFRQRFAEQVKHGETFDINKHWTPREHYMAAQAVRDFLVEKGLLLLPDRPTK
jgi:hypothetical protein